MTTKLPSDTIVDAEERCEYAAGKLRLLLELVELDEKRPQSLFTERQLRQDLCWQLTDAISDLELAVESFRARGRLEGCQP